MTWTTNRPTVPGWYWFRGPHHTAWEMVQVYRSLVDSMGLIFTGTDRRRPHPTIRRVGQQDPACLWAGPIPLPEPPAEGPMVRVEFQPGPGFTPRPSVTIKEEKL